MSTETNTKSKEQKLDRIHELLADRYLAVLEDKEADIKASMLASITKFLHDSGVLKARAEKIAELESRVEELTAENNMLNGISETEDCGDSDVASMEALIAALPNPTAGIEAAQESASIESLEDSRSDSLEDLLHEASASVTTGEDKAGSLKADEWSLSGRLGSREE